MTTEFLLQNCVPLEIAKSLKEIGFDGECIDGYSPNGSFNGLMMGELPTNSQLNYAMNGDFPVFKGCCTAPLFQQVFDWFDMKGISGYPWNAGSMCYTIHHSKGNESDCGFPTRKWAQVVCIEKMIEIYKEQNG